MLNYEYDPISWPNATKPHERFMSFSVESPLKRWPLLFTLRASPLLAPPPRAAPSAPPDGLGSWPRQAAASPKPLSVLALRTQ